MNARYPSAASRSARETCCANIGSPPHTSETSVQYGVTALVVHYVIFAIVITGFWAAIRSGWEPSGAGASVGTWTAAYLAAKITQPLRIVATVAITPFVARAYERVILRKKTAPPAPPAPRGD